MEFNFSKCLKRAMKLRGVSQAWLADAANTKEATISRYVNGVNKSPQVDIMIDIAKALNVSTDYLLGLSDTPYTQSNISGEETVLISTSRKATARDMAIVWQILEDYATPEEKGFLPTYAQNESKTG